MAYVRTFSVTLGPTASDGSGTFYSSVAQGFIEAVIFDAGDIASGADLTITDEATGLPVLTATNPSDGAVFFPRAALHSTVGAALLFASGGEALVDKIPVNGRIRVVVADGGNAKTGMLHVLFS